jgi:ABC-2 type transport system permease protein
VLAIRNLGEELVDKTLARYDYDKAFQQPPYTTTTEFLDYLREDAGAQWNGLIDDLLNKITVYDNRVTDATTKKRADGKFDVTLKLHSAKTYVDGVGKETPAKVEQPIDISVFARAPGGKASDEKILYLQKRMIADGDSTITLTVDAEPLEAGIDPYNKLIDRASEDNRRKVTLE